MKLKSVGLGIFSALTFLFMIGTVSARSIDVTAEDITNQNCIYLQKKDDDCIVQRWER